MASEKRIGSGSGLKVIGAGLPRTSTLSLRTALEQLGFDPCYHVMTHLLADTCYQGELWRKICKEENKAERQKLLRSVYEGQPKYADPLAAVDAPTCFFADDLLEIYPDAKVVCSVRDSPEAWLKSFMSSVGMAFDKPLLYWMTFWNAEARALFAMHDGWNEMAKKRYGTDVRRKELYPRHIEWVKKNIPADRLLLHNAKQGWGPLCEFLGVPVPETPYPHVNDSEAMNKEIKREVQKGLMLWVAVLAAAMLIFAYYKYF